MGEVFHSLTILFSPNGSGLTTVKEVDAVSNFVFGDRALPADQRRR